MGSAHPPLDYLVSSSESSLESFELARLNAVANLRKELRQIVDEWIEAEIEARMARWILDRRRLEPTDSQAALAVLSRSATPLESAVGDLPPQRQAGDSQTPDSKMSLVKRRPTPQRPGRSSRKSSQRMPLSRNRELPFDDRANLAPGACDPSLLPLGHAIEADPNLSAAVAALQGLERVAHSGARGLPDELEAPGKLHPAESQDESAQLSLSRPLTCPAKVSHSIPPPTGNVPQLARNWQASRVLSALVASAQKHELADGDGARHAPPPGPCPAQELHTPFGPIRHCLHRIAAAS